MVNIYILYRWVCDDLPEIKAALEKHILCDYDTHSYESMRALCDRFNRAIDSVVALVNMHYYFTQGSFVYNFYVSSIAFFDVNPILMTKIVK